jgi:small subunit ribosomal protein S16
VSVRIRLTRAGRKKVPHYRIVVMDSRNRRDGAYLEQIGVYHPNQQPAEFEIAEDKALRWLSEGAQPSDTVRSLMSQRGILLHFDLLKRQTPPEKIAEAVGKWREDVQVRAAKRAAAKAAKRQSKTPAGDSAAAETPPTS